jgi:hypothetical protein
MFSPPSDCMPPPFTTTTPRTSELVSARPSTTASAVLRGQHEFAGSTAESAAALLVRCVSSIVR